MYLQQILQGLEYLHGKGITHGDIKGQNILLTQNREVCKVGVGVGGGVEGGAKEYRVVPPQWTWLRVLEALRAGQCGMWNDSQGKAGWANCYP